MEKFLDFIVYDTSFCEPEYRARKNKLESLRGNSIELRAYYRALVNEAKSIKSPPCKIKLFRFALTVLDAAIAEESRVIKMENQYATTK